jgi:Spy/CpxP family protein refolding chaperone
MKSAIAILLIATATYAQPQQAPRAPARPDNNDPIARELFPPELIMGHQEEIQLQEKQRATIRVELTKLQTTVVDLQWQMSENAGKLAAALRATPVDEAKALDLADKVMNLERDIKRLHLTAVIRIKNVLTPEQIAQLREIRARER